MAAEAPAPAKRRRDKDEGEDTDDGKPPAPKATRANEVSHVVNEIVTAARDSDLEGLQWLVSNRLDFLMTLGLFKRTDRGVVYRDALIAAAGSGATGCVLWLTKQPRLDWDSCIPALAEAVRNNRANTARYLACYCKPENTMQSIIEAATMGHTECVRKLMQVVRMNSENRLAAVAAACKGGHGECVKLLQPPAESRRK